MRPLVHRKLLGQLAASAAGLSLAMSGAALAQQTPPPAGAQEQSSNQSLQAPLERLEQSQQQLQKASSTTGAELNPVKQEALDALQSVEREVKQLQGAAQAKQGFEKASKSITQARAALEAPAFERENAASLLVVVVRDVRNLQQMAQAGSEGAQRPVPNEAEVSVPRSAADERPVAPATAQAETGPPSGLAAMGRSVVGKSIYGQDGEEIAEIEDVVVTNGQVQAVLVDVGGFLGFGAKRVALALTDLKVRGDRIVAPKLKEQDLTAMPAYSGVQ
jgi:sporulation protein YlmC with PRC-barrel domain